MFRQQAGLSPGLDWSQLNSSLFAVTFLAQQNGRGKTCRFCLETDHSDEECALAPGAPQVQQPSSLQGQGPLSRQDPNLQRAGLVELVEVCVSHGMRVGAHSLTAASGTSASGVMETIGRRGAKSRPPGIVLLSVEL